MSYQLSKPFAHFQIIIATITKAESHGAHSNLPAVKVEIAQQRFPRALLFDATTAILVTCEPGSWVPVDDRRRR
jgi:hypothetical protein